MDKRNVIDAYKGIPTDEIKTRLDASRSELHIAIENLERDFNMGTIVRTANAFNIEAIHIVGKKQWNKRGAMATDLYMNIFYYQNIADFQAATKGRHIIGIDNVEGSVPLTGVRLPKDSVLVFGSEKSGLSDEMIRYCESIVKIEQFGSTRSLNVGVASGIAMYTWMQRNLL